MSLITSIYKAPMVDKQVSPNSVWVVVRHNGRDYPGFSTCSPEDMPFFSERIGTFIADSRARQLIMEVELGKLQDEVRWKKQMWMEIKAAAKVYTDADLAEVNYSKAVKRLDYLKRALQGEKEMLAEYIAGHDGFITSIKRLRESQQDKND